MSKTGKTAALALLLALPTGAQAQDDEARLKECRKLHERIKHYTGLRRKGGSAARMESWKKQLRKHEARFRELDCSDFRRELR
ncbi:MAG: hypothetical protein KDI09_10020 [Halioglobus sp.]|nr:hypothetical protein [Halioglobus sp.]